MEYFQHTKLRGIKNISQINELTINDNQTQLQVQIVVPPKGGN